MALQSINLTGALASGGNINVEKAVYEQTLVQRINGESVDWAFFMLDKIGKTGEALANLARTDNTELRTCPTVEAVMGSNAAVQTVISSPIALDVLIASPAALKALITSPVALEQIWDSAPVITKLLESATAQEVLRANAITFTVSSTTAATFFEGKAIVVDVWESGSTSGTGTVGNLAGANPSTLKSAGYVGSGQFNVTQAISDSTYVLWTVENGTLKSSSASYAKSCSYIGIG